MLSLRQFVCRISPLVALGIVLSIPTLRSYRSLYQVERLFGYSSNLVQNEPKAIQKPETSPAPITITDTWTRTLLATSTVTSLAATTVTSTATVTIPHDVVTSAVTPKPPGPAFCDVCGPGDSLCSIYGGHNLARSRVYEGANARFRRVITNAQVGRPTRIGVIGGSVTQGHGLRDEAENWAARFFEAWKVLFPKSATTLVRGTVAATGTEYFSMCYRQHIDDDVDLVIIELSINDQRLESNAMAYEWLIRGLLALPHSPAVLNLHTLGLFYQTITIGGDMHTPVAEYYDAPVISLRNMLLPHILERPDLDSYYFNPLGDGKMDWRHVNVHGHKIMADLLVAYTQRQVCAVEKEKSNPSTFSSDQRIPGTDKLETIPRLRFFQQYDRESVTGPITPTCQTIRANSLAPIENIGWREWSYRDAYRDKPYLIATEPGSLVRFNVVTSAIGRVRITYLRSKHFGLGNVRCWLDDDKQKGIVVVSWWDIDNINVANVATVAENATPGKHILSCELTQETGDPGGGHEFRLVAVDAA